MIGKFRVIYKNILLADDELIEKVRCWRNSKSVSVYMLNDHYITKEEHRRWVEKLRESKDTRVWVIYANNLPIGTICLENIDYRNRITNWGFYIGENDYRGLGIGSMALYRLMEYVFDKVKLHKMYTFVLGNNHSALSLYKKFGFKEEGRLRKHVFRNGKYIDVFVVGILEKEWEEIKYTLPIVDFIDMSDELS